MPDLYPYPQVGYLPTGTSNMVIWQDWVQGGITTGTVATTFADPWGYNWVDRQNQVIAATQNQIWQDWQVQPSYIGQSNIAVGARFGTQNVPPQLSEEEACAFALARKRNLYVSKTRSRSFAIRRRVSARRAETLLLEHLTDDQIQSWRKNKQFTVHTADGKRLYSIAYGMAGNIRLVKLEGEAPVSKHGHPLKVGNCFCMHVYHPDGEVPTEDNVLAQKLIIEANEEEFLRLANVS